MKIVFPKIFDIGCFSHTIDHVGENIKAPVLDKFAKVWIGMFSRSPKTKLAGRTMTGLPIPTYSATRWWSLHCSLMLGHALKLLNGHHQFQAL